MARHPDIEVYLKDVDTPRILDWLSQRLGAIEAVQQRGLSQQLKVAGMTVVLVEQAAGKRFTSLFFDSAHTPWETDQACAEEISQALDCQVRCIAGSWAEEQDPDEWLHIEKGQCKKIIWRS